MTSLGYLCVIIGAWQLASAFVRLVDKLWQRGKK